MYDCVRNALKKTGTDPRSIDILVVNCSLFSPTPSLCSMVRDHGERGEREIDRGRREREREGERGERER
jgi:FAE1/Type III polyketide synthase-like protein